uniref:Dicarbonyl and L-xylulose reductase n=2 Tax=Elapinae TaxID=42168 RepID=A0A8C6XSE0_NAJNA
MERFSGRRVLVTGAGKGSVPRAAPLEQCWRFGDDPRRVNRVQQRCAPLRRDRQGCGGTAEPGGGSGSGGEPDPDRSREPAKRDWEATEAALSTVEDTDLLVNNAAVAVLQPFLQVTKEAFDRSFSVNLRAVLQVSQIFAQKLIARGAPGVIVNVSSQASQRAMLNHTVYSATKSALDMLTKSMALELGPHKIRVNCVNPTVVMTNMGRLNWSDPQKSGPMLSRIPLGKFAELDDVVNGILFLLSDQSNMTTGATLPIDGGFLSS